MARQIAIDEKGSVSTFTATTRRRACAPRRGPCRACRSRLSYHYDAAGDLDAVVYPNGVVEDYDYSRVNGLERLTVYGMTDNTQAITMTYDYTLGIGGRREQLVETVRDAGDGSVISSVTTRWAYDNLDRLVLETRDANGGSVRDTGDYTDAFVYDLAGNRVQQRTGWDTNGDGKLQTSEPLDSAVTYAYNSDDQLVTKKKGVISLFQPPSPAPFSAGPPPATNSPPPAAAPSSRPNSPRHTAGRGPASTAAPSTPSHPPPH